MRSEIAATSAEYRWMSAEYSLMQTELALALAWRCPGIVLASAWHKSGIR
jgi:hypothetical protein